MIHSSSIAHGKQHCNVSVCNVSAMLCRRRRVRARVEEFEAFLEELQVPSDKRSVLLNHFMVASKQMNPRLSMALIS